MSDTVIKITDLSKLYKLGEVGTGTLSHDLNRWWARIRGKEDPFAQVGQVNDRTQKPDSGYVWALKDINLQIKQGEVLGIIGANGAGKSTLLKLISRITSPTTGLIKVKGRIASLLEIGTGMHPDLTARENVFLNGAIMGMKHHEIRQRFDEIIDFAGCGMYVDTPTKRFSSGMRIRLGFSVAAFLEPEILIIDEVLAVGDVEFREKCLGKMSNFASAGRTVLFVSHNMSSINTICDKCIAIENGKIAECGSPNTVIENYLNKNKFNKNMSYSFSTCEEKKNQITHISLTKNSDNSIARTFSVDEKFSLHIHYLITETVRGGYVSFIVKNRLDEVIFVSDIRDSKITDCFERPGSFKALICFPSPLLVPGKYSLSVALGVHGRELIDFKENVVDFKIIATKQIRSQRAGHIYMPLKWHIDNES